MRKVEVKDAEIMRIVVQQEIFDSRNRDMITIFRAFCLYVLGSVALRWLNFFAMGQIILSAR